MDLKKNALALAVGLSVVATGSALAGIANTRHNLGSTNTDFNRVTATPSGASPELCVFCHTPHGGDTSVAAPLWNKATDDTGFSVYGTTTNTSTLDGTPQTPQGVTLACLSCHDGTQALDAMINAPGSGNYDTNAPSAGYTFADGNLTPVDNADNSLDANGANGVANLGKDLNDDHPVSIEYGGGGTGTWATDKYLTANLADSGFKSGTVVTVNSKVRWFVEARDATPTDGSLGKEDMILYETNDDNVAYVECASCHDPHTETATFLRTSNAGSNVCLSCHIK